jgi:hypothetical protein
MEGQSGGCKDGRRGKIGSCQLGRSLQRGAGNFQAIPVLDKLSILAPGCTTEAFGKRLGVLLLQLVAIQI